MPKISKDELSPDKRKELTRILAKMAKKLLERKEK